MPPTVSQESSPAPSPVLALVCASIVAEHDPTWLARPVSALIPDGGPRPERICRLKARLRPAFEVDLAAVTRRGRPNRERSPEPLRHASLVSALLEVATWLLAQSRVPIRRRSIQDQLVCTYDRLYALHAVTQTEFCAALALSVRTFRAWRSRPPAPPRPTPPPRPPAPPRNDRATGRFDLDVTAPGVQLGGDTTDLSVFGIGLKLVGTQDLGAREQRLFEAFAVDERENADLIVAVLTQAVGGREGLQFLTDQGTPYMAEAAAEAYEALGVEHAPQKERTPTEKATVERAWLTVKSALAPLFNLTGRLAEAIPTLKRPDLARAVATLLIASFLRVYAAGRRHLSHPLAASDPDALRAIVDQQRANARAEDRSSRLFLEAVHAEYAMPGSREAFVRTFKRYPLDDLKAAERRFRAYACRCQARVCDRYFAAVVRDAHERGHQCRADQWRVVRAEAEQRRAQAAAAQRTAELAQHPERRLHEGLDLLAETWQPDQRRFLADGGLAHGWLRCAVTDFYRHDPLGAPDAIEAHARAWQAAHPDLPATVCEAVRQALALVITEVRPTPDRPDSSASVGAIFRAAARRHPDNQRPPPPPHLPN